MRASHSSPDACAHGEHQRLDLHRPSTGSRVRLRRRRTERTAVQPEDDHSVASYRGADRCRFPIRSDTHVTSATDHDDGRVHGVRPPSKTRFSDDHWTDGHGWCAVVRAAWNGHAHGVVMAHQTERFGEDHISGGRMDGAAARASDLGPPQDLPRRAIVSAELTLGASAS